MALNVVSSDRLSTNVKTSNLATGLSSKVGESKNLVINGAMQVAQRGTSSTSTGYQTVDRITMYHGGTDEAPTYSQADVASGTTPYTLGFRKCFKVTNGNQTSGAGAGDEIQLDYKIEAQDIASSGWNYTSASSYITLSFWAKSSVAQEFKGHIISKDGTSQNYPFSLGSLSADTWTKITKKIPGNSNLQFDSDNGEGLKLNIFNQMGTNFTGSVAENTWAAFSASTRTPDQTLTWYTTNDATFEITGFQVEVGDTATEFEHRSYGDDLARCQRYCYEHFLGANQYASVMLGGYYNSSRIYGSFKFPVTMRTAPTMVCTDIADGFNCYRDGNVDFVNEFHIDSANNVGPNAAEILNDTDASGTGGWATIIRRGSSSTVTFRFEAEL